jgi:hypothetical protein
MKEAIMIIIISVLLTGFVLRSCVALFPFARKVLYRVLRDDIEKKVMSYSRELRRDVLGVLGLEEMNIYLNRDNDRDPFWRTKTESLLSESERDRKSLREALYKANRKNLELEQELKDLKNPPKPSKFKIGDRTEKYAVCEVWKSDMRPYVMIDSDGRKQRFTEGDVEAMMKLNKTETKNIESIAIEIIKDKDLSTGQKIAYLIGACQINPGIAQQMVINQDGKA